MAYTQENRAGRIQTPFGEDEVLLHRLSGQESISRLFRYDLDLRSGNPNLSAEDIVGKSVSVELGLDLEGEPRRINGVISRFSFHSQKDEGFSYRAELVPWLWFLTRSSNCRIFQDMNVLEIMRDVWAHIPTANFETGLEPPSHYTRQYNVQYRELDINFLCRLYEQQGYWFFFKHEGEDHTLVLTNGDRQSSDCPELEEAVRYVPQEEGSYDPHRMIRSWARQRILQSGQYTHTDYNYEDPRTSLLANTTTTMSIGPNDDFELYDFPGEYDKLGEPDSAKLDYGEEWARLRMQEEESDSTVIQGEGTCHLFVPGTRFELTNHIRGAENGNYLITSVTHTFEQEVETSGGGVTAEGTKYENSFTCIPADTPFVPRRTTAKPRIRGPHTAEVVGEDGSNPGEVRIDEKGRVKVKFPWDRNEDTGGDTTCWIRVSNGWAGGGWGAQFHPRIGHEVLVSFLEGDPDRPVITGRVYNGVNEIPYSTPTQGGIKTRSTPEGSAENYNEIRFEDEKDNEELYVQAEKNLSVYVKNDKSEIVDANVSLEVGKERAEKIGENRTLSVGGDKTESVSKNKNVSVTENLTEAIDGKANVTIGKEKTLSVGKKLTIDVGDDMSSTAGKSYSVTAGKEGTFTFGGDYSVTGDKAGKIKMTKELGAEAKEIVIEAEKKITLKVGDAELIMKDNGDVTLKGGKIEVKGSGDVKIKGSKVSQN